MSAHETLKTTLADAVTTAGQPPSVTKRLTAWLDDLSKGATDLTEDWEDTEKRLETVIDAIVAPEEES